MSRPFEPSPTGALPFGSSIEMHVSSQEIKRRLRAFGAPSTPMARRSRRVSPRSRRLAVGLSLLFLLSIAALAAFTRARATEGGEPGAEIGAGTLVLHPRGGGADLPAVRLGTHYEVRVSGRIARTRVVQAFRNTGRQWAAATYLYPLP